MKYDTDFETLKHQVIVETYRSGGPGGQRKNKTETAIRLTHLPSGITVTATTHRQQSRNLEQAFETLRKRLEVLNRPRKRRVRTSVPSKEKERRIEEKRKRSTRKQLRRSPLSNKSSAD